MIPSSGKRTRSALESFTSCATPTVSLTVAVVTVAIGIFAFLATLGSLAALSRLHLLPTGYRPASNAVGDYGVGAYGATTGP